MFKTLFWLTFSTLICVFIVIFILRYKKDKIKDKSLALAGVIIALLSQILLIVLYLFKSVEPSLQGTLLTLALGTWIPIIMLPILMLAPIIISAVLSIITRKIAPFKQSSIWMGLFIIAIAFGTLIASLIA